jgi:MFS transporter, DHA2 family, multidrug resistance protein
MASTVPAEVPSTLAETARDTLGAAEAVAASLPERTGAVLLDAARAAFTEAVVLTAMVSAALAIAAAIVTATMLRAAGSQSPSA